ncbi:breast cancer metastasis-suppressor 1-like protein isoform X1 [Sipha flava]|uniref:Breast cancer metastasis-suppressor 1-like protein isoform X1 n=1 Tax=Sipha flava TaxID=143950 RepID=A0A8B8FUA1_9HEMI|nr:breast cancer metastasis-suppressor 1-like protein isoform X1 [Sipha flava]
MSTVTSSDNSDIIVSRIQNISEKHEEIGSEDTVHKAVTVVTEKVLEISYDRKKLSEISASSSSSSSDSSSSDTDTDNSSDLDEDENEKEQKRCDEKLREIESGFYLLKEMLYKERIREVEEKLVEVRLGTAKEYRIPLQELQDQMKSRLEVASVLRQFKLANLKHKYEAEEQAIRQNFENNKEILYDTIKADLEEKIQRLEEARNEVDIDASLWLGRSLTRSGRGRGRRPYGHVQPKRKPVIISGPCIVYMLKEHEILEDWTTIKKILSSSRRRENADQRYKPY